MRYASKIKLHKNQSSAGGPVHLLPIQITTNDYLQYKTTTNATTIYQNAKYFNNALLKLYYAYFQIFYIYFLFHNNNYYCKKNINQN